MEVLNHIFYFNMGLNCPTEVVSQFSIFSPNTPLQDHCEKSVVIDPNQQFDSYHWHGLGFTVLDCDLLTSQFAIFCWRSKRNWQLRARQQGEQGELLATSFPKLGWLRENHLQLGWISKSGPNPGSKWMNGRLAAESPPRGSSHSPSYFTEH